MKKSLVIVFLLMLGFVFAAAADNLGDLAKKEKARREALEKNGKKAKVYTKEDLERVKDKLGMETASDSADNTVDQIIEDTFPSVPDSSSNQNAAEQLKELQGQKTQLEQQAQQAQDSINRGGIYQTHNVGAQYKQAREANDQLREVQEKIEKAQQAQDAPAPAQPQVQAQEEPQQDNSQDQQQQEPDASAENPDATPPPPPPPQF